MKIIIQEFRLIRRNITLNSAMLFAITAVSVTLTNAMENKEPSEQKSSGNEGMPPHAAGKPPQPGQGQSAQALFSTIGPIGSTDIHPHGHTNQSANNGPADGSSKRESNK